MLTAKTGLVILDGWGIGDPIASNAIYNAKTPFFDSLLQKYPHSKLIASGLEVGLPIGQMGNSEVGHLNLGAGRIVYQDLVKINKAIEENTLQANKKLIEAFTYAQNNKKPLHLMGLVSDGGVHSHINHLIALCDIAVNNYNIPKIYIHAFLDGRDTDPNGGVDYLKYLNANIDITKVKVVSIIGRYYAMDRDKRWERIKKAYDLLIHGIGNALTDLSSQLKANYKQGVSDEFMKPICLFDRNSKPVGRILENDVVLCFNFRTDRCREITEVLTQTNMPNFSMKTLSLKYFTMTNYSDSYKNLGVLYDKDNLKNTLGEVLSKTGKTQLRAAETEKYPHVTFFFSGGREKLFEGERRVMAASPKVATYDLQPEMSAKELTDKAIAEMSDNNPDFVCLNYANPDMVGHTGVYNAIIKAVETVDNCLEQLVKVALAQNRSLIVIADHGNADFAINEDGSPNTAHTTNPVPCVFVSNNNGVTSLKDGILADVAPTILNILGVKQPIEMTGKSLLT